MFLLMVIPVINVIVLWWFAFSEWPAILTQRPKKGFIYTASEMDEFRRLGLTPEDTAAVAPKKTNTWRYAKHIGLIACLWIFSLMMMGSALKLDEATALLGATVATPLIVFVFNRFAPKTKDQ